MSWLQIIHETTYRYKKAVRFAPYRRVLRPREGHDVRIEQIRVEIEPEFELPLLRLRCHEESFWGGPAASASMNAEGRICSIVSTDSNWARKVITSVFGNL